MCKPVFNEQMTTMKTALNKQQGSMLLEALTAILIFSLGILSLVALLGASVKHTSESKYRTEANVLANELIGTMWGVAKPALAAYATDGIDYNIWKDKVSTILPGVSTNKPTVVFNDDQVTVTIKWQAPGETRPHQHVVVAHINNG
jgi:type IV pilus assembly protein PilV